MVTNLKRRLVLLLLLVDYTQSEINFIGLLEVWLHAHDLRERFLGMLERTVAIIEYADAIPKFGLL
jgi:hypothetical protein